MSANKASQNRIDFLYNAAHTIFATHPSLSRFYMSEYEQCMRQENIVPAKSRRLHNCPKCGQIYAPGLNTTVFIHTRRKDKKRVAKSNYVTYTCNACNHAVRLAGATTGLPKIKLDTAPEPVPAPITPQPSQPLTKTAKKKLAKQNAQMAASNSTALNNPSTPLKPGNTSSPKTSKKKNKKDKLQALLTSRKQNNPFGGGGGGGGGGSLDDFLSSL